MRACSWRRWGIVGLVAVAGLGAPATSAGALPPGLIAYVDNDHDRSGHSAIMVVRPDGRGRRVVHRSATGDDTGYGAFSPAWSANGRNLAFSDYVTPTGDSNGTQAIFVQPLRGGPARQLTPSDWNSDRPAWSPDSSHLAFTGQPPDLSGPIYSDVYTVAADGTGLTRLTHTGAAYVNGWLRTGRIAFSDAHGGLFTMAPDGSDVRQVPLNRHAIEPSWSPLGRNIVFVRDHHVFIERSDGTHVRALTTGRGIDSQPAFSSDGRWIVFARQGSGPEPALWLVDIHGHHAHRVIAEPTGPGGGYTVGASQPTWQP